jgi:hypothetical protein
VTVALLYGETRRIQGDVCGAVRRKADYRGPYPVVAFPPPKRHEVGLRAIELVRTYGGVVAAPAPSQLWGVKLPTFELPRASWGLQSPGDEHGGYSVEVELQSWGRSSRGRTWLYLVRVPRELVRSTVRTGASPSSRGDGRYRETPRAFVQWLVMLAEAATASAARR